MPSEACAAPLRRRMRGCRSAKYGSEGISRQNDDELKQREREMEPSGAGDTSNAPARPMTRERDYHRGERAAQPYTALGTLARPGFYASRSTNDAMTPSHVVCERVRFVPHHRSERTGYSLSSTDPAQAQFRVLFAEEQTYHLARTHSAGRKPCEAIDSRERNLAARPSTLPVASSAS